MLALLGSGAILFGVFFLIVGALGIVRLPDALSRLHASGKVGTLGLFGLLVGVALLVPAVSLKLVALGIFVLVTAPVATHAIALAYHSNMPSAEDKKTALPVEQEEAQPFPIEAEVA